MKKNIFKIVTIAIIIFGIGFALGSNKQVDNKVLLEDKHKVAVQQVLTESTKDFKLDKGDVAKIYTDGSWSIENDSTDLYVFQPVDLGDYDIECKSKEELNNMIQTYLNMNNKGYF